MCSQQATMHHPHLFFGVEKPGDVTWGHRINGKKRLQRVCQSPDIMMVEGDISYIPKTGEVIMAHDPSQGAYADYDEWCAAYDAWVHTMAIKPTSEKLYLSEWIETIVSCGKGIKLDFKRSETVAPAFEILREVNNERRVPVFVSADIMQGPGGFKPSFDARTFIEKCNRMCAEVTLVVGWNTRYIPNGKYHRAHFEELLGVVQHYRGPVVVSLRACFMRNSYKEIQWFLSHSRHTISVWNNEVISDDLMEWIRKDIGLTRAYYDLDIRSELAIR